MCQIVKTQVLSGVLRRIANMPVLSLCPAGDRVKSLVHILVALCILTGYSIMTASFVIYEVQEHHSGSKQLQHISGIGEPFYWAINFLYDMVG